MAYGLCGRTYSSLMVVLPVSGLCKPGAGKIVTPLSATVARQVHQVA
jgi:hypothetical protein